MIVGSEIPLELGQIVDTGEISRHDKHPLEFQRYPPGTKAMVIREACREEWVKYTIEICGRSPVVVREVPYFYELSLD